MLKIFIQNLNEVDYRFLSERKTLQPEMSSYKKKKKNNNNNFSSQKSENPLAIWGIMHIILILCKKTALKNTWYTKDETSLNTSKNGLHAKAIAFAKSSVWVKK